MPLPIGLIWHYGARVPAAHDLAVLPSDVAEAATIADNGEVLWQVADAGRAVEALTGAGFMVLGLDVRDHDEGGRFVETAWSVFEPTGSDDVEKSRRAALAALERLDVAADEVLITWRHSTR